MNVHMIRIKRLLLVPFAVVVLLLTACDRNPKEWKTPNMTALTPRLQAMFEKTKTVCFGRFMVDVPASAIVVWGNVDVPLGVTIYPAGADHVQNLAQKFIDELKSEKAIYHDDVPLLLSIENVNRPEGKIVTGYDGFEALTDLRINGYFKLHADGVVIDARPLQDDKDGTIAEITSIARRLRQHVEGEIPNEPGNCIQNAFLPDEPGTNKEQLAELIRIGFRLKEFSDTHLSIFVGPSNPHYSESDSLSWRLDRLEKGERAQDPNHPLLKTNDLRRGARQIGDWMNGFEALSRTPERAEVHSIHDFAMDFRGVPSDPLKPYAEIQMQTGVANDAAGAAKASLTDEEAIAVWDKITSTIRVRPINAASLKTTEADSRPRSPLGELSATGRTCPQTGWWQATESAQMEGGGRQHIKAGDRMPHVVTQGEPSMWQKLKGEMPTYRTATVWKLVSYEDARTQAPVIAQASVGTPEAMDGGRATDGGRNDETPPQQKG
jgi:hypothetical protein